MPGWYEGIGSTNFKGYRPAEMDAQQLINQGYSSPNVGVYGPAPRNVPSMRAPTFSGQVGFTAPAAMASQAFGRVASADYGGASRSMGRADAATIRPNDFEAGVLARSGLRWNPSAGQAERVGVQAPMMAARPGVQAPAPAPRGMISGVSDREAAARSERLASRRVPTTPLDWAGSSYEPRSRMAMAPPAPPSGGGGPRMGPDPRAQAVQAAMQAFAESSARYGGGGRGMINLAGIEAGQAYDQRQLQSQQLQQANELERQKIAVMAQETESRRAAQIPPAAQMYLKGIELGMSPPEISALMTRTGVPQPGIGVRAPGSLPPIGVASPAESEAALTNAVPPEVLGEIRPNENVESVLIGMANRGFDPKSYTPDVVEAMRRKLISTYGMDSINAATADARGRGINSPWGPGLRMSPDMGVLPKPLRILAQPFNYYLGGSGTGAIGDPVDQLKQRAQAINLWRALGGQPSS